MTHPEKLNRILYVLLDTHRKRLDKQPTNRRLTFAFICKTVAEVTEDWETEFLKQQLLSDGYMKMSDFGDGEPFEITPEGIKFIQQGAYEKEKRNYEIEQKIKEETLKKFQFDKWAFTIAILSLVIAVISLFSNKI